MVIMEKINELIQLEKEMIADVSLPLIESNLVFGEGNPNTEVVFIGEAPGFYEDQLKRPFVGRSGKFLDQLIQSIKWDRKTIYITNIVKRRPPRNRDPFPKEIDAYKPYLTRQLHILSPKLIITLGRFSMNYFLPNAKISQDHGKIYKFGHVLFIPFFHPAAALRSSSVRSAFVKDFKKLPLILRKYEKLISQKKSKEII